MAGKRPLKQCITLVKITHAEFSCVTNFLISGGMSFENCTFTSFSDLSVQTSLFDTEPTVDTIRTLLFNHTQIQVVQSVFLDAFYIHLGKYSSGQYDVFTTTQIRVQGCSVEEGIVLYAHGPKSFGHISVIDTEFLGSWFSHRKAGLGGPVGFHFENCEFHDVNLGAIYLPETIEVSIMNCIMNCQFQLSGNAQCDLQEGCFVFVEGTMFVEPLHSAFVRSAFFASCISTSWSFGFCGEFQVCRKRRQDWRSYKCQEHTSETDKMCLPSDKQKQLRSSRGIHSFSGTSEPIHQQECHF